MPRNLNTLLSLINFGKDDEPSLAIDKVRYKGEPMVAIVADSEREAYEALAKVRVDYEVLPPVFDIEEALKPGAPVVNETYPARTLRVSRAGTTTRSCASATSSAASPQADHVLEQRYQMSPIEHAPTETNGSHRRAGDQRPLLVLHLHAGAVLLARHHREDPRRARRTSCTSSAARSAAASAARSTSLTEPLAILGAMLTGRPVRYVLGREEEMQFGSPRGAESIFIKDGVMKDGRIVARKVTRLFRRRRLYAAVELRRAMKCAAHIPGPYTIPNVARRHLLRLHQPHAVDRHARLRRHRGRFRARSARWTSWRG